GIWADAKPVGAWLAGDGDFMGAIASKPAPTDWGMFSGFGLTQNLWEPGLPAMAILMAPSPASRLLQVVGVFGIWVDAKPVGAWLAGDGDFMGTIASKPAPTDWGCFRDLG
ncbi:hypothetical protein NL64_24240, partial [Pseudomonas fluorescens]|uniref:hypothetical protein n=1 Tax=Pseudomonas fluorescens TaxID=294 RepID=UPI00054C5BF9